MLVTPVIWKLIGVDVPLGVAAIPLVKIATWKLLAAAPHCRLFVDAQPVLTVKPLMPLKLTDVPNVKPVGKVQAPLKIIGESAQKSTTIPPTVFVVVGLNDTLYVTLVALGDESLNSIKRD